MNLRATMSQQQLNHMMLLYAHKDRKDKINTAKSLPYIYPYAECLEGVKTHTVKRLANMMVDKTPLLCGSQLAEETKQG